MRILLVLMGVCVLMSALTAADLSGKWTGTFFEHENEGKGAVLILKQNGNNLTGTAGPNEEKQFPITKGKVDGDKVTFDIETDEGPVMHFDLTATEKRLIGSVHGEHDGATRTAKLDVTKAE